MKVSSVQMNMILGNPAYNFSHAEELIRKAAQEQPDVICLPETWNVGFFPTENLKELCDRDGAEVKRRIGGLAKELGIHIVAGSVANLKQDQVYNTAYVFGRQGELVAEYDKTHLFTPMGEHNYFAFGGHLTTFDLDGIPCGIVICYDIRFVELVRLTALRGMDVLFVVAQWPDKRVLHWNVLNQARAIENQMFVACTNSCGKAGETQFGGNSALIDPWGDVLVRAGADEEIITADLDRSIIADIRSSINVFRDRRTDLYDWT